MLCQQARDHLSAYLDRELASELSSAVRAHLESCAGCRALLADLRATAGLLGALPVHRAPADLAEDVQREIERCTILPAAELGYDAELQERTLALRRVRLWPRALAVAASVLLVVGIGVLALLGPAGRRGRLDVASGPETVPAPRSSEEGVEVAKVGAGSRVGSTAALAKKEALDDYRAADRRKGGALEGKEGGWGGGLTDDLAKVPERPRAGPSDLGYVAKAPGPDSLDEDRDRGTRLRVAEKPSGDEREAVLEVQRAMNLVANGEARVDELKQVASVNNLRLAGNNTLVIETDAPAEANKDLTRLFLANDWQPVAPPPAKADVYAGGRAGELGRRLTRPARLPASPRGVPARRRPTVTTFSRTATASSCGSSSPTGITSRASAASWLPPTTSGSATSPAGSSRLSAHFRTRCASIISASRRSCKAAAGPRGQAAWQGAKAKPASYVRPRCPLPRRLRPHAAT